MQRTNGWTTLGLALLAVALLLAVTACNCPRTCDCRNGGPDQSNSRRFDRITLFNCSSHPVHVQVTLYEHYDPEHPDQGLWWPAGQPVEGFDLVDIAPRSCRTLILNHPGEEGEVGVKTAVCRLLVHAPEITVRVDACDEAVLHTATFWVAGTAPDGQDPIEELRLRGEGGMSDFEVVRDGLPRPPQ
jgi:hypothetical protein